MKPWLRTAVILGIIWICAGAIIFATRSAQPTAASVAAYIEENPLEGLSTSERRKIIDRTARQMNRLGFEERQVLRQRMADRSIFRQMTPEERGHFLEATMPEGFRQLMLALNKMEPAERKKIVQRALDDLERDTPEISERLDAEQAQKIIQQGLGAFYEEASAEVKLDFAPVLERLQRATQGLR